MQIHGRISKVQCIAIAECKFMRETQMRVSYDKYEPRDIKTNLPISHYLSKSFCFLFVWGVLLLIIASFNSEYAFNNIDWEDTKVLDKATRPVQLLVKEALCIQRTPANNRLNRVPHVRSMWSCHLK